VGVATRERAEEHARRGVDARCAEIPKVLPDQPGNCVINQSKTSLASAR
jgi:hypothetical protein